MRRTSLRFRLLRDQLLLILFVGAVLLASTFVGAEQAIRSLSEEILDLAVRQTAGQLVDFFEPAERALEGVQAWGDVEWFEDPQLLRRVLGPFLLQNPQFAASLIADDRGRYVHQAKGPGDSWLLDFAAPVDEGAGAAHLVFATADSAPVISPFALGFDPRDEDWYRGAVAARESATAVARSPIYWTTPGRIPSGDPDLSEPGMTASIAVPTEAGVRVVAFRVRLVDLNRFTRGIETTPRGRLAVLSEDGLMIAGTVFGEHEAALDERLLLQPSELGVPLVDAAVAAFQERQGEGGSEPVRFTADGEAWWAQVLPFALGDERRLFIAILIPAADLLVDRGRTRWWILGVTGMALLLAMLAAISQSRTLSRPVEELVRRSDRIRRGDLDDPAPLESSLVEVRNLADAQNRMRSGLRSLMKLESDLAVARRIQLGALPQQIPRVPGFEIVAFSEPAEETGGDSYDVIGFEQLGDDVVLREDSAEKVILMLADATGHGVGPALSVTQVRSMLRMAVRSGSPIGAVVRHVNEQLYADLPPNRFVTAWLGALDGGTSMLTSYSAGQAPLLHYRAAERSVQMLIADAPPLGLGPTIPSTPAAPIPLAPGDLFVVLSDGLFETENARGEEFGRDRVAELLRTLHGSSAQEILDALLGATSDFSGGRGFSDDRTAVIVRRLP